MEFVPGHIAKRPFMGKMILIAHRGNIDGPNPAKENYPSYLNKALDKGYNVEVDVWFVGGEWFLGHDGPQYDVDMTFLLKEGLWCHAKNFAALERLLSMGVHCFWHDEDAATLTSEGYIWTYPGKPLTSRSICVMPEKASYKTIECAGVCTDYVTRYE